MAMVPRLKASYSKAPMGPFQTMVLAFCRASANSVTVAGPISAISQSRGTSCTGGILVSACFSRRAAPTPHTRRRKLPVFPQGGGYDLLGGRHQVIVHQGFAHLVPHALEKSIGHGPADDH